MGRKEKKMKNTKLQAMIMAGAMAASSLSAMSVFADEIGGTGSTCLLYTSPSPRDTR